MLAKFTAEISHQLRGFFVLCRTIENVGHFFEGLIKENIHVTDEHVFCPQVDAESGLFIAAEK